MAKNLREENIVFEDYNDVVFVAKHGSSTNSGLNPQEPVDDIKAGIDIANILSTGTNRVLVKVLDSGEYGSSNYNMTLDDNVDLDAEHAIIDGRLVIRDESKVKIYKLRDDGQGFPTINMNDGNNQSYVVINELDTTTTSTGGYGVRNTGNNGVLIVQGDKFFVGENVVGCGDQSANFGHIHLHFEDIYLAGNNSTALASINANNSLVVYANHILPIGAFTGTKAIDATINDSVIFVTTNEIDAETAINVTNGAIVHVTASKITGDIIVDANSELYITCREHIGTKTIAPGATVVGSIGTTMYGKNTFDEFPVTPSAAPTLDYEVSNKKYVDDEIGLISTDLDIGTTPIINGTAGRILFEGAGNVLQESANLLYQNQEYLLINEVNSLDGSLLVSDATSVNFRIGSNVHIGNIGNISSQDGRHVVIQRTGLPPTRSLVDAYHLYAADVSGGNTSPHFRTENGTIISPYIHHQNIREDFSPLTIGAITTVDCGGLEMVRRTLSLTQNTILALSNLGTWTVLSLTVTNTSGSSWDVTLPSGDKAHPGQSGPFTVNNNEEIELNALYNGSYVTWTASAGPLETIA